jgi:hypothetical protein
MKKSIYISIIFLFFALFSNAQKDYNYNNIFVPGIDHFTKPMQNSVKDVFPFSENNSKLLDKDVLIWNWDTIVTYDTLNAILERRLQTFDTKGNVLTKTIEKRLSNSWVSDKKYTYSYDADSRLQNTLYQSWLNNSWSNHESYTYYYDISGFLTTYLYEEWQNNSWVNANRESYTYDADGNRLSYLEEKWIDNNWRNYNKGTFTYNQNGKVLTFFHQVWMENNWMNACRFTSTYGASGNLLVYTFEMWITDKWENFQRSFFIYDSGNNKLSETVENWETNSWINSRKNIYTYDPEGLELTNTYLIWQTNQWINLQKDSLVYDEFGNQSTKFIKLWEVNEWVYRGRFTYIYDDNGNALNGQYEKLLACCWTPEIEWLPLFSKNNNKSITLDVLHAHRYEASFLKPAVGVSKIQINNGIKVFPNPAHNNLIIEFSSPSLNNNKFLSVYNDLGKLIHYQLLENETTIIDLSGFAKGLYFVKITDNSESETIKIIKQ